MTSQLSDARGLQLCEGQTDEATRLVGRRVLGHVSAGVFWLRERVRGGHYRSAGGSLPGCDCVGRGHCHGDLSCRRVEWSAFESSRDRKHGRVVGFFQETDTALHYRAIVRGLCGLSSALLYLWRCVESL